MSRFIIVLALLTLLLSGCPKAEYTENTEMTNPFETIASGPVSVGFIEVLRVKTEDGYLYITCYDTYHGGGCSQTLVPFKTFDEH